MKLVVGLGNPGRKYDGTRHNVGYRVIAELAKRYGDTRPRSRFQGDVVESTIGSERTLLLGPQTYMNKSGASVLAARDFYKLENQNIIIVCDDFNLPLGRLRIRGKGSAGGQKGLGDIIRRLGTDEVPRLRIGVGPPPPEWDVADFVLSKFRKDEVDSVESAICRAADAVSCWLREGVEKTMNQFNAA